MDTQQKIWALVPFWHSPDGEYFSAKIEALIKTVVALKKTADGVVVVSDGVSIEVKEADKVIAVPNHVGKAEAIRQGIRFLLADPSVSIIVQCDADLDQNPADAQIMIDRYGACPKQEIAGGLPVLIIGDRYSDKKIIFYRRIILWLSKTLFGFWGMPLRDVVSGFRLYNRQFAIKFVELSKSSSYGLETEMVVCAYLMGAFTDSVMLTYSRPRDPFTVKEKVRQNVDAILLHGKEIKAKDGIMDRIEMAILARIRNKMDDPRTPKKVSCWYTSELACFALLRSLSSAFQIISFSLFNAGLCWRVIALMMPRMSDEFAFQLSQGLLRAFVR